MSTEPAATVSHFGTWRSLLPGLWIAGTGLIGLLSLAILWGSYGWAFVLMVPIVCGMAIGYLIDYSRVLLWLLALLVLAGAIGGLFTMHLAGVLCGLIAGMILIVPMGLGASLGLLLRVKMERRDMRERRRQVTVGLFLATAGLLFAEGQMPMVPSVEVVETTRILEADRMTAWDSLVFYEDVGSEPPRLAQIGIPYPVGTIGIVDSVGDTKRCIYVNGHLMKQITEYRPGEIFAFEVIEQVDIEDRSVELIDGSFEFEEIEPGRTRVTLTTRYKPLLQARPVWKPFEHAVVHTLHDHVLNWMALNAAAPRARSAASPALRAPYRWRWRRLPR